MENVKVPQWKKKYHGTKLKNIKILPWKKKKNKERFQIRNENLFRISIKINSKTKKKRKQTKKKVHFSMKKFFFWPSRADVLWHINMLMSCTFWHTSPYPNCMCTLASTTNFPGTNYVFKCFFFLVKKTNLTAENASVKIILPCFVAVLCRIRVALGP